MDSLTTAFLSRIVVGVTGGVDIQLDYLQSLILQRYFFTCPGTGSYTQSDCVIAYRYNLGGEPAYKTDAKADDTCS